MSWLLCASSPRPLQVWRVKLHISGWSLWASISLRIESGWRRQMKSSNFGILRSCLSWVGIPNLQVKLHCLPVHLRLLERHLNALFPRQTFCLNGVQKAWLSPSVFPASLQHESNHLFNEWIPFIFTVFLDMTCTWLQPLKQKLKGWNLRRVSFSWGDWSNMVLTSIVLPGRKRHKSNTLILTVSQVGGFRHSPVSCCVAMWFPSLTVCYPAPCASGFEVEFHEGLI